MSVIYLHAGMLVVQILSAIIGDTIILSYTKAKADQAQNEDFASQDREAKENYEVHNIYEEKDEGEDEMLNDVDETGQENVKYNDDDDSSDEEDVDGVDHHGGHNHEHDDEEEKYGEKEDVTDDMDEHHFSNAGFEVDVAVHVGGHHGADENYFGRDGEYDVDVDDNRDDDNDDKDDFGIGEDEKEHEDD
nr:unnamed protein product [Spirometra erinaceieuropaei]